MVPIKIKEAFWDNMEIAQLKEFPEDKWMSDINDHKSWAKISGGIEMVIEEIKERK
ncbi:MAG: hypothetical protein AAFZ15_19020 [Bacteroidota bacterium]